MATSRALTLWLPVVLWAALIFALSSVPSLSETHAPHAEGCVPGAQSGVDVWWDTLIEGGAEFTQSIEAAINPADAVVVA